MNAIAAGFIALLLAAQAQQAQAQADIASGGSRAATLGKLRWATQTVPVCWEAMRPEHAPLRELLRRAVAQTWEKHSGLRTSGWQQCQPLEAAIRISVEPGEWPRAMLGKHSQQTQRTSMWMNFSIDTHPSFGACKGRLEQCITSIGIHEFGHALGFIHEQDRPDTPADCDTTLSRDQIDYDARKSGDLLLLSAYDAKSQMNYCNKTRWHTDKPYELSGGDIEGIQKLFGAPPLPPPPPPVVVVPPKPPASAAVTAQPPASSPQANPLQPLVDLLRKR